MPLYRERFAVGVRLLLGVAILGCHQRIAPAAEEASQSPLPVSPALSSAVEPPLPFPATRLERCRVALQILLAPPAATRLIPTANGVSACGATSGYALATLLGVHRHRTDTLLLEALELAGERAPHAAVFEAGAVLAADTGASPPMRITGLRAALHSLFPGRSTAMQPDSVVGLRGKELSCATSVATHAPRAQPMPSDAVVRLRQLASGLVQDSTTPKTLRDAAYCVARYLGS